MSLTPEFINAVGEGNITRVRIMLKDSILLDPSGNKFDDMIEYAKERIPSLMSKHDGEVFKSLEEWNEDYLNEQMVSVVSNFSKERLEFLKKISHKLFYKPKQDTSQGSASRKVEYSVSSSRRSELSSMQKIGLLVTTAGAATVVIGLAARAAIAVPIIGGAAMIGGGAIYVMGKEN